MRLRGLSTIGGYYYAVVHRAAGFSLHLCGVLHACFAIELRYPNIMRNPAGFRCGRHQTTEKRTPAYSGLDAAVRVSSRRASRGRRGARRAPQESNRRQNAKTPFFNPVSQQHRVGQSLLSNRESKHLYSCSKSWTTAKGPQPLARPHVTTARETAKATQHTCPPTLLVLCRPAKAHLPRTPVPALPYRPALLSLPSPGLRVLGARAVLAERETSACAPFPLQVLTNAPSPAPAAAAAWEPEASTRVSARRAEELHCDRLLDILAVLGAELHAIVDLGPRTGA